MIVQRASVNEMVLANSCVERDACLVLRIGTLYKCLLQTKPEELS